MTREEVKASEGRKVIGNPQIKWGFFKYVEPATLLTLSIGAVYYVGWSYMDGLFHRIGLHHLSFELSTTQYLRIGFLSILIAAIILSVFFRADINIEPKTRVQAFFLNLPIIPIGGLCVYYLYRSKHTPAFSLAIAGGIAIVFIFIGSTLHKKPFMPKKMFESSTARIMLVLVAYYIVIALAYEEGEMFGQKTLEGSLYDTSVINFTWKDAPIADLEGKQLILLMYKDSKYYVAQKESPAPDFPRVYIVSEELIKYATISEINK
jgi:hypothetical protein